MKTLSFEQKSKILDLFRTLEQNKFTTTQLTNKVKRDLGLNAARGTVRDIAKTAQLAPKKTRGAATYVKRDHTERQIILAKGLLQIAKALEFDFEHGIGDQLKEIVSRFRMDIDDGPENAE
jgi:hypothetical protein